jgi:hypothetical protein
LQIDATQFSPPPSRTGLLGLALKLLGLELVLVGSRTKLVAYQLITKTGWFHSNIVGFALKYSKLDRFKPKQMV